VLHLVAAAASAWALWGTWIAATVTVLCLVVPFTELPRWRALLSATHDQAERPARQ
jgi:heme exporter protein D